MTTKKEMIKDIEEVFGVKVVNVELTKDEILFHCDDGREPIRIPQERE